MADAPFLTDTIKLLTGGALGYFGKAIADRRAKARMRRHLYKELGYMYGTSRRLLRWIWKTNEDGVLTIDKAEADERLRAVLDETRTEYHTEAKRDLNTFLALRDSYAIDELYRIWNGDRSDSGEYFLAYAFCAEFEGRIHRRRLSRRLALTVMEHEAARMLQEHLEYGEEHETDLTLEAPRAYPT